MAKHIDVYRDWLGITDPGPPFTHYQLLSSSCSRTIPEGPLAATGKLNAHVRKFATGEFGPQSQDLLNELAKAMLCLTDAERKANTTPRWAAPPPGEGRADLRADPPLAARRSRRTSWPRPATSPKAVGLEVRDAVLQQRTAAPEAVMQAYAESVGRPYLDLADLELDPELVEQLPAALARQHACVPVMADEERVLVASPLPMNPDVEDDLRLRFGRPARSVFCTKTSLDVALAKYYAGQLGRPAPAKPAAKPSVPKPAAKPAKQPAKRAADEDDSADELTPEQRKKRMLVIGGLVASGSFFLFMIYWYLKVLFGK